jgi:predicted outer membrane repeat protein
MPIPEQFKNKYSLLIDGGTTEHIFNIPVAYKNIMDMVMISNNNANFFKLIGANGQSTINVEGNGVLRLNGITVTHETGSNGNGVTVSISGKLVMSDGEITGNKATNGGGVFIQGSFSMSGGKIINNIESGGFGGGGVYVDSGGSFEMSGGEISSNSGGNGGGVHNKGVFVMLGGRITNNAGVIGGGVCNRGTFTMKGGVIANNNVTFLGHGGGVSNWEGTFSMTGGEISYNTAATDGGGVYVNQDCTFSMTGGTITYNKATEGGGVYLYSGNSFKMSGGSITNNQAGRGGGVYGGGFTMSNGEISGNTATNGGGMYIYSICRLTGGKISDNTATNSGGGVWIHVNQLDQLFVSNGMIFSNNRATTSHDRNPEHDAIYAKQIGNSVTWTTPFTQGYNNYDIGYTNNIELPNITPDGTPGPIRTRAPLFTVEPSTPVLNDKGEGLDFRSVSIIIAALVVALVIALLLFISKKQNKQRKAAI